MWALQLHMLMSCMMAACRPAAQDPAPHEELWYDARAAGLCWVRTRLHCPQGEVDSEWSVQVQHYYVHAHLHLWWTISCVLVQACNVWGLQACAGTMEATEQHPGRVCYCGSWAPVP